MSGGNLTSFLSEDKTPPDCQPASAITNEHERFIISPIVHLNSPIQSCLSNICPTANKDYAKPLVLRECTLPSGCAPLKAPTNPHQLAGAFLLPLLAVSTTGHMSKQSCRSRLIGVSYSFTNVGASITAKSRELTSMNAGSA